MHSLTSPSAWVAELGEATDFRGLTAGPAHGGILGEGDDPGDQGPVAGETEEDGTVSGR